MNKTQLVEKIADKAGLTKAQARSVLRIVEAALVPAPTARPAIRRRAKAARVVRFKPGKGLKT